MIVTYAVETQATSYDDDGEVGIAGVTVTFEFENEDYDGKPITQERAWEMADEILHEGRTSSTSRC